MLLYDSKRWRVLANVNNLYHKQKKDSAYIVLLSAVHDRVSVLFDLWPLGSANILKLLVKQNNQ